MKHTPALLAFALGAAAGCLGYAQLRATSRDASSDAVAPIARSTGATSVPSLQGLPADRLDSLADEAARAARALSNAGSLDGAARLRTLAALASIHAVAGGEAEFLRVAERLLRQGASLDELLPALAEFPQPARARLVAALLELTGDVPFDVAAAGRMLAEGGLADRALALVRSALPRRSDPDPALLRLLLRLAPSEAPGLLLGLEASGSWDATALGVVRAAFIEAGQDRALVPFLTRALDASPGDRDLLRWLARIDPGEALTRLRARVAEAPEDASAWSLLADLRRDTGDAVGAFEAYRSAAALAPGRSTFRDLVRLDPARGLEAVEAWAKDSQDDERLGALGEMYLLAGRKEDALRALLRAHENDPDDGLWIERLIAIDPAAAVEALGRRVAAAPAAAGADLLGRYGSALAAAGRTPEAFAQVLAAFRRDPDDGTWQEALATLDPGRALPVLEGRVREQPGDASASGAYGLALAATGRREEAAAAVEAALARGEAERWYTALARLDPARAIRALDQRARSDANDPDVWGLLGGELGRQGRTAEARHAYEAAAALEPGNRTWAEALRNLR